MASANLMADWTLQVNCKVHAASRLAGETADVAAMFGLAAGHEQVLYDGLELTLRPGEITAIVGPSGAGKSVLLREAARRCRGVVWLRAEALAKDPRPAMEVLSGDSVARRLEMLSRCGLADAAALITPARRLSGGQRHRLALAAALHRASRRRRPTLVLADEFCSTLDTLTAQMLCRQVRKLVSRSGRVALLLATPRAELLADLAPDVTVVKRLGDRAIVLSNAEVAEDAEATSSQQEVGIARRAAATANTRAKRKQLPGVDAVASSAGKAASVVSAVFASAISATSAFEIVAGNIADYRAMAQFHYLAGPPAAHKRVYVAKPTTAWLASLDAAQRALVPSLAGVLVVSPPVMNVRGRNQAFAGRYCGSDRKAAVARLNAELECISRVIVHPAFRGAGLAVMLVRHALRHAQTPRVEALAAMGAVHPLFELAGMRGLPVSDVHAQRLLSAAQAVGLTSRQVAAVEPARRVAAERSPRGRFLRRELKLYQRRAIDERRLARLEDPLAEACRKATRRYVYYAFPATATA